MTTSNFDFKSELSNISNALDGTPLAQDALGVFNQRTAGLFSLFQNAEQLISGIQNLTQIDNHGGSNVFLGTGITKLTENVPGFEEDLKTDVSSDASDLTTMNGGDSTSTSFRKKFYGASSVESLNEMLTTATGKSTQQLLDVLKTFQTGDFQNNVFPALTTTLQSVLATNQLNFQNVANTFIKSSIGNPLQDIVDTIDKTGSLFDQIDNIGNGILSDDAINTVIGLVNNEDFNTAVSFVSSLTGLSINSIEPSIRGLSTKLNNRVVATAPDAALLPDFEIGTVKEGYDDASNPSSQFSVITSLSELEGIMRNASRDITEMVLHWSESFTNQYLTAEDLHKIQGSLRYHFVILRDGRIQKGLSIDQIGNHVPAAEVAQNVASASGFTAMATAGVKSFAPAGDRTYTTPNAANHNKYSIGVCMIGGIACPAGNPDYDKFLGDDSFTPKQWDALDNFLSTFYRVFPGGQVFGHNDLEVNEPDPGFSVSAYIFGKFRKQNISTEALSTDQLNKKEITKIPAGNVI